MNPTPSRRWVQKKCKKIRRFRSWRIAGKAKEPILRSQRSQKRTVRMASEVEGVYQVESLEKPTLEVETCVTCPKKLRDFWLQNNTELDWIFILPSLSGSRRTWFIPCALFRSFVFWNLRSYMVLGTNCGVQNHCLQHSSWLVDRTSQLLANTRSEAALGATNDLKATCMMY